MDRSKIKPEDVRPRDFPMPDGSTVKINEYIERDDKYYTPEIEEFHIGFEYEAKYQISDNFGYKSIAYNKQTIELEDYYTNSFSECKWKDILKIYKDGYVRVKYLDKEDIEDLRFKQVPTLDSAGLKFENEECVIKVLFYEHLIGIVHKENPFSKFSGTIKNKSELKVLLKQLNIQ